MTINIQTYRPRATVEAIYFEDAHAGSLIAEWTGGSNEHRPDQVQIPDPEGPLIARLGEWVIRGHEGRFFTWPADTFAETYERVVPEDEQVASLEVQRARLQLQREQLHLANARAQHGSASAEFAEAQCETAAAEHEARVALADAHAALSSNARTFVRAVASPASMPASIPPRPTLGRAVLYQGQKTTCAAIVAHVHEDGQTVNLTVCNAIGSTYPAQFVGYAETPTPGRWSWLPQS